MFGPLLLKSTEFLGIFDCGGYANSEMSTRRDVYTVKRCIVCKDVCECYRVLNTLASHTVEGKSLDIAGQKTAPRCRLKKLEASETAKIVVKELNHVFEIKIILYLIQGCFPEC